MTTSDLDLDELPLLRRLAAHDRVHTHEVAGDESGCEPCVVERELRKLLRREALVCYHIVIATPDTALRKIGARWTDCIDNAIQFSEAKRHS